MHALNKGRVELTFAQYRGDQLVRRDTIAQDIVKIGKDPRSHLRIEDELASRMHAVIEAASPDDITLIDLGNEPGTMVRGQRVNKCKLQPGDPLRIGSTTIVLERADRAEAPAPAPAPATARPAEAAPNPFAGANPFAMPSLTAKNPFLSDPTPSAPAGGATLVPAPGGSYAFVRNAPAVADGEVEMVGVHTAEVRVLWGDDALAHVVLSAGRRFTIGEDPECDWTVPGIACADLVSSKGGATWLRVPSGGKATLGGRTLAAGEEVELARGDRATVEVAGAAVAFEVTSGNAPKALPGGLLAGFEPAAAMFTGMSFALHMGLVATFAFFMPSMRGDQGADIDRDQVAEMRRYLDARATAEDERREDPSDQQRKPDSEGGKGEQAAGESGTAGNPTVKTTNKRFAVAKQDDSDPHLARQAALNEASQFGMIGLISTLGGGDPNAPTSPWGRETSNGEDEKSARGNMFGDGIGDAFGTGGLGLTGVGEGAGGKGRWIGLGDIGIGHGRGTCTGPGPCEGIGHGRGGLQRGHTPTARMPREAGAVTTNGRLPPEVIQRIVRQNFGRFRTCYEAGLRTNPTLQGRVAVRFAIDRTGAVSLTSDGGSDLPDQGVVQCVVRGFGGLSFPQPEGGMVTVVYPIMFTASE